MRELIKGREGEGEGEGEEEEEDSELCCIELRVRNSSLHSIPRCVSILIHRCMSIYLFSCCFVFLS